jgi:hypothetical protein
MLTATKQASKANAPFWGWGALFCVGYALLLWAGPRAEDAVAPVATHVEVNPQAPGVYLVTADVEPGCSIAGVRASLPFWAFGRSTEYHLMSEETARVEVVVGDPLEGAAIMFNCPWRPWVSRVPIWDVTR